MLPLLGQTFRIDIVIPYQARVHERVRHSARSQSDVREAFVTQVSLSDTDSIAIFGKRTIHAAVVAESDVGRARVSARFESDSEKPIVSQRAAQTNAHAVAFTMALQPIARVIRIVTGKSAAAIFITHARITVELDLVDRRREFPFPSRGRCHLFYQVGAHFLSFLISNESFLYQQIEQGACLLRPGRDSSKRKTKGAGSEGYFLQKHCFSLV